jgi:hypothetical protein
MFDHDVFAVLEKPAADEIRTQLVKLLQQREPTESPER